MARCDRLNLQSKFLVLSQRYRLYCSKVDVEQLQSTKDLAVIDQVLPSLLASRKTPGTGFPLLSLSLWICGFLANFPPPCKLALRLIKVSEGMSNSSPDCFEFSSSEIALGGKVVYTREQQVCYATGQQSHLVEDAFVHEATKRENSATVDWKPPDSLVLAFVLSGQLVRHDTGA